MNGDEENLSIAMAALSPNHHVRLISLLTRLHPSTISIDHALTKLQTLGALSSSKTESIHTSISGLQELQKSIQQLILELLTRNTLFPHERDDLVKLLEEYVTYIDICSKLRDAIMTIKQGVQEVQSALRRRGKVSRDLCTKRILKAYICTRKNREKEIKKSIMSLKHARDDIKNDRVFPIMGLDEHGLSSYTMKILREASMMTASILQSIVTTLLVPISLKTKCSRKWTFVSKFLHRRLVKSEGQKDYLKELEEVEVELSHFLCPKHGEDRMQSVQRKLEVVDAIFEGLEHKLGSLFRGLVNTRVSLLNVVSDQYIEALIKIKL